MGDAQQPKKQAMLSSLEDPTWKRTSLDRPEPPWTLEETERGHVKFGSVGDLCSGVLSCGDLHAAVTGCSLGWLNAWLRHCRACLT